MAESNLLRVDCEVVPGADAVTVVRDLGDLPGGRTLDVTEYRASLAAYRAAHPEAAAGGEAVYAGTPVGYDAGRKAYVALPLDAEGAFTLPSGARAVGVVKAGVPLADARAAVLTIGQVNWAAIPFRVPKAVRDALPRIEFLHVAE